MSLRKQRALPLPPGLSLTKESSSELKIVRRWFSGQVVGALVFGLIWNGLLLLLAYNTGFWIYVFLPHGWVGLGLIYYVLSGFLNTTEITVTADRIEIKHGPIPALGNSRVDSGLILQLFTKRKTHHNKNRTSYSYEIHMLTNNGQSKALLKKLSGPEQALYLEKTIERFLDIEDGSVPGEFYGPHAKTKAIITLDSWQALAKDNHLEFRSVNYATRLFGPFHGYELDLVAHHQNLEQTRIELTLKSRDDEPVSPSQSRPQLAIEPLLTGADITELFSVEAINFSKQSSLEIMPHDRTIRYHQPGVETSQIYLQFLFDLLADLLDDYPKIVAMGGEVIPILQPVAAAKEHPLRHIAATLIEEIVLATLSLSTHLPQMICRRCLTRGTAHQVQLSWVNTITYYGCRVCHQSQNFYRAQQLIAELDSQQSSEPQLKDETLVVNWLTFRELFDFDEVTIIQATDEDVERLAVQVGNDTDPSRQSRYKTMPCRISSGCRLTPNTIRILQRTFGTVEISQVL